MGEEKTIPLKRLLSHREIQLTELDILLTFARFCEKHNLKFYLAEGTLLGAVRHKGFIPWDDDIDISMPRPDYDRLCVLTRTEPIAPNLRFVDGISAGSGFPFGKILDLNTEVKIKYIREATAEHLWIDVYPVDGLPNDLKTTEKLYGRVFFLSKLAGLTQAIPGEGKTKSRALLKYFLKPIACCIGRKNINRALESLTRKYSYAESRYVGIILGSIYGSRERIEKTIYEEYTTADFEGCKFPVFSAWDVHLSSLYGDYLTLPAEENRIIHITEAWVIKERS